MVLLISEVISVGGTVHENRLQAGSLMARKSEV